MQFVEGAALAGAAIGLLGAAHPAAAKPCGRGSSGCLSHAIVDMVQPYLTHALVGAAVATAIAVVALVVWRGRGGLSPQPAPSRALSERVRHEVWRRDQGRCVDCGSRGRLEFDHIIPFSRGGSNTARNIELRCEPCNRRKGARI